MDCIQNKRTREIPEILKGQVYLDPRYNAAFKELFDSESALKDFLDGALGLEGDDKIKTLSFNFEQQVSFRTPLFKEIRLDIFATTGTGRFLDIEMQKSEHDFFIDRAILYKAFLIIKGKKEMEKTAEFRKLSKSERELRRYELPETISIWICDFDLPKPEGDMGKTGNVKPYMDEWLLYSRNNMAEGRPISIFPKNRYIIFSLPNFRKSQDEVRSSLDAWLYLMTHASDGTELPSFGNSAVKEALERIRVENANDELLTTQGNEMSHKYDYEICLAGASIRKFKEGREVGRKDARKELARAFRDDGFPLEAIAKRTGFTPEEIMAL